MTELSFYSLNEGREINTKELEISKWDQMILRAKDTIGLSTNSVLMLITPHCESNCGHCCEKNNAFYNDYGDFPQELFDKLNQAYSHIGLTGGNPLLKQDYILKRLKSGKSLELMLPLKKSTMTKLENLIKNNPELDYSKLRIGFSIDEFHGIDYTPEESLNFLERIEGVKINVVGFQGCSGGKDYLKQFIGEHYLKYEAAFYHVGNAKNLPLRNSHDDFLSCRNVLSSGGMILYNKTEDSIDVTGCCKPGINEYIIIGRIRNHETLNPIQLMQLIYTIDCTKRQNNEFYKVMEDYYYKGFNNSKQTKLEFLLTSINDSVSNFEEFINNNILKNTNTKTSNLVDCELCTYMAEYLRHLKITPESFNKSIKNHESTHPEYFKKEEDEI